MQSAVDLWEGTLRATGGAISAEKTKWWLFGFTWSAGQWRYTTVDETPATLSVRDVDGSRTILTRLAPNEAMKTLGVYIAPDRNNKMELEYLMSAAKRWADNIRTGRLPRELAWQSLQSTISKTLQYPLSVTTLTKDECDLIVKCYRQTALNSLSIVRNFPRKLTHGPKALQGLGIPHLYTVQGIK